MDGAAGRILRDAVAEECGLDGLRRLGARRRGHAAWSRSVGRGGGPIRGGPARIHGGDGGFAGSRGIEAALLGFARQIEPAGRVELIRGTGEHAGATGARTSAWATATRVARGRGSRSSGCACGAADHGWIRLHLPEAGPAGGPDGDSAADGHGLHDGGLCPCGRPDTMRNGAGPAERSTKASPLET